MTNADDIAHCDNFASTANDNVDADDRSLYSRSWQAPDCSGGVFRFQSTWSDRTTATAAYVNLLQSTARAQIALPGFASMTNADDIAHCDNFVSTAYDNVEADDRSLYSRSW